MTHEEFLSRLISGFAGEPSVPFPHYGGANEEDAICRWLAYRVAIYVLEHGSFELDERGRLLGVLIDRVWRRWGTHGTEEVDLRVYGRRGGTLQFIGLKACVTGGVGNLLLRISDWSTRRVADAVGIARDEPHGGVRIADPGEPHLWTMPSARAAAPEASSESEDVTRLPPCCQRSLETIVRILESGSALAEILAAAPSLVNLSRSPRPAVLGLLWKLGSGGAQYARMRGRMRGLTNVIVRERVRTVIELELCEHNSGTPEGRHWATMLETLH